MAVLKRLLAAEPLDDPANLPRLLVSAGVQVIHFAGHGTYKPVSPHDSELRLGDLNVLRPAYVLASNIGESDHPLMFVNACDAGRSGWLLTQIGGWADVFCGVGFSAFVGPYWAVDDQVAGIAAETFYTELLSGRTVGQAMKAVRQRFWSESGEFRFNPTWLAYSLHCHPNLTVRFTGRAR